MVTSQVVLRRQHVISALAIISTSDSKNLWVMIRSQQEELNHMNNGITTESTDDWARFDAMTEEERHEAALSDPDALPWTEEELNNVPITPSVTVLRRALGLTQEEFSSRYDIELSTLQAWEEGRSQPDHTAYAYLKAIAAMPEAIRQAVQPQPVA
jgi:putative transcriptional regulator